MLGLFVWAIHFLILYPATATACQLGLQDIGRNARSGFLIALVGITTGAVLIVVLHAVRRHRQLRLVPESRFRMWVTLGCDALAAVAIVWQLFAILLVPICI
jgi:hypothetical protein